MWLLYCIRMCSCALSKMMLHLLKLMKHWVMCSLSTQWRHTSCLGIFASWRCCEMLAHYIKCQMTRLMWLLFLFVHSYETSLFTVPDDVRKLQCKQNLVAQNTVFHKSHVNQLFRQDFWQLQNHHFQAPSQKSTLFTACLLSTPCSTGSRPLTAYMACSQLLWHLWRSMSVSYTHLTLPTNREV